MIEFLFECLLVSLAQSLVINAVKLMMGEDMIFRPLYIFLESIFRRGKTSKYRDESGRLYIAKPIYACVSCMPSVWSIPLLFFFPPLQVLLIAFMSVVISTLIYDKLYP